MATNPYIGVYRAPARQVPRGTSLLDQTIIDDRDNQRRLDIISSPPPEQVARQTRVARESGVAPAMVDDVDVAETMQRADKMTRVLGQYPAFGRWASDNPRAAVAASDDHESLGMLGKAWDALKAGGSATAANLSDLYRSIDETIAFANPTAAKEGLDRQAREAAAYRTKAAAVRPTGGGFVEQAAMQGIESLPGSLTALAVGLITRSPAAAAGFMGLTTGAPAYQDALAKGKGRGDALRYGIEQFGSEALFELAPQTKLLSLSGKPLLKATAEFFATEIPGELGSQLVQSFSDWVNLNPDKPYGAWVSGLPAEAAQTVIATITGGAGQVAAAKVVGMAGQVTAKVAGRVASAAEARRGAKFLDQAVKVGAALKFKARDPEGYGEMLAHLGETHGVTHVSIPGEAIGCYMADAA